MSGAAAYKQLRSPDNSVSQSLQFWGANQSKQNAAKKLADERQGVREDQAKQKKHDEFIGGFNEDEMTFEMTGNKNFNDVMTNYTNRASAKAADLLRQARELESSNPAEARRLQGKYNNLKSSYKTIAGLSQPVQDKVKWHMEHSDELNPFDNRFKFSDAIAKNNFMMTVDDNGKPKMIVGLDKDGDGEISTEEQEAGDKYMRDGFKTEGFDFQEVDPNDFVQGAYDQFKKVDINGKGGLLDKITSTVGVTQAYSVSGDFITTSESLSPQQEESLKTQIRMSMKDPETKAYVMNTLMGRTETVQFKDSDPDIAKAEEELFKLATSKYGFKTTNKQRGLTRSDIKDRDKKNYDLVKSKHDLAVKKYNEIKSEDNGVINTYNKIRTISEEIQQAGKNVDEEGNDNEKADIRLRKILDKHGLDGGDGNTWVGTDFGQNDYRVGKKNIESHDDSLSDIMKAVAEEMGFNDKIYNKLKSDYMSTSQNKTVSSSNENDPLGLGI